MITRTDRIATRLRLVAPLAALAAVACAAPSNSRQSPTPAAQPTPARVAERQRADDDRLRNDWASLRRYRQANDSLRPPAPGERRVVFMGNSITDSWARFFAQMFPGKPYIGRGISGQATPQMLARFRQDVVALRPAVVVILAGTNDIAGNTGPSTLEMIEDNLMSMTELAKANGIRVVFFVDPAGVRLSVAPRTRAGAEDRRPQRLDEDVRRAR